MVAETHPNAQVVLATYRAIETGDVDSVRDLVAEDVRWQLPGVPESLTRGREQALAFMRRLVEGSDGTYRIVPHDILANDDHVVALEEHSCVMRGERMSGRSLVVHHVRDGRIVEAWVYPDDTQGSAEFVLEILDARG